MTGTADSAADDAAIAPATLSIETLPYPAVVVDPAGEITAVNERLVDRIGTDSDSLVGRPVEAILSIPDGSMTDTLATCAESGHVTDCDARLVADEQAVPISLRGQAVTDDEGTLQATHWQFHDREAAPVADDGHHASMETIIEAVPHPLYVLNVDDYTIQHANSLADGYPGTTCYSMTHDREQPCDEGENAVSCPLQEVVETGEPTTVEHTHYDADGNERVHEVHAAPIVDDEGRVVQLVESLIDTTERVASERRLKRQRDDLETLNQVLRHDIRNDLQLILAYGEVIADAVPAEHEEHVETIRESAEHAVGLTKTAREMSDVLLDTDTSVGTVRLRPLLESEIDSIRAAHDAASITVDGGIPAVTVPGNDMLSSVFRNLLKNAIQHNDKPVPEVTVSVTVDAERVTVRIADNGPGVPDDQKAEIFGKGETRMDTAGTGLGLYLVETLVSTYDGSVTVDDNEPHGAIFAVTLPRAE